MTAAVPPAPVTADRDLADAAVEALGGTPSDVRRGPSVGIRLPGVLRRRVTAFDTGVDRAFERIRGRGPFDKLFYAASELGDFALIWHLLGTAKGLRSDRDVKGAVRLSAALGIESVLVNGVIKSMFRRNRPVWEQHRPRALRRPRTSSFPSGHASSGFMAARLLSEGDPAWRGAYAVAAVVAASRIHVRIHHASDVLAGAVLGIALGTAARRLVPLAPRHAATRRPPPVGNARFG